MRRVFVLGNATLDVVQGVPVLPAPGETLLCDTIERCAGGKGLNQAVAAARAGAPTVLIAPVGDDPEGGFLRETLAREEGLVARWLPSPFATDLSSIWVARDGENMIVSSAASALSMSSAAAAQALDDLGAQDVLLVQGNLSRSTTGDALDLARRRGATTLLNTAPIAWDMNALVERVDLVIANEIEAAQLSLTSSRAPSAALLVTRGSAGAVLSRGGGAVNLRAPEVEAVDTSGAGDVTAGTLAAFLARGFAIEEAVAIAIAAASLSVTRRGTTSSFPSAREIEAITARRN